MKKQFLMFAVAAMAAQTMSAQTLAESKFTDNWYVGINGGANFRPHTRRCSAISTPLPVLG